MSLYLYLYYNFQLNLKFHKDILKNDDFQILIVYI